MAIIFLIIGNVVYSQNGTIAWAKRAGSQSIDEGNGIVVDADGNAYVTGYFKLTATFGQGEANETVLTALNQDIFVAKYAANGDLAWVKQAKGSAWGNAIGLDGSGNIYLFGHYGSQTTFNTGQPEEIVLPSTGQNVFLAKFDPDGKCLWARQDGGTNNEYGNGLAVDAAGNCYVTGRNGSNPATFGAGEPNETVLPGLGGNNGEDIFIAKYDTNGLLQWAKNAGGPNGNNGAGIGVDASGNCYVTGRFSGPTTFGPGEAGETILEGGDEAFVAKYGPNGNLVWVRSGQGQAARDEGTAIAVDSDGNSYTTGTYRTLPPFGGQLNPTQLSLAALDDIFVAKHDTNGNLQWVKMAVGPGSQFSLGIASDENGNSYITGYGGGITFGSEEDGAVSLGGGAQDIFVAKFDDNGLTQWAKIAGGSSDDRGHGIAFMSGSAYVIGRFGQTATFGFEETNQTAITSRGNFDVFVAKFQSDESTIRDLKFVRIGLLTNGNPELTISGTSSKTFTIRRSGTLEALSWNTIGNIFTNAQGQAVFEDTDAALVFPAFYEAIGD
ncbi:MAG: SBBP repeat-containing protein [Verrucomicrobia bacterium]|nr:SBBP repeat-containing protein [Verrucomicrobiota bacterium]MDA1067256.1 SBBP repeat-containing protein [Verrucomicrobiota bacterium]